MKNYDEDVAKYEGVTRTFTLRGVEFTAKPIMPADAVSDLAFLGTGKFEGSLYVLLTGIIRRTLVAASRDAWDELLLSDLDVPIALDTFSRIANELVEDSAGRPTQPPSPSGATGGTTTTPSTDGFVSPGVAASAVSTSGPAST
jgi:hypothetical protein